MPSQLDSEAFAGVLNTARIIVKSMEGWSSPLAGLEVSKQGVENNTGSVSDGYISGATVFIDLDRDGEFDIESEPFTITDENGNYSLTALESDAPIVAFGGTDISTNTLFNGTLSAPNGAKVINPLTTVIEKMVSFGMVDDYGQANRKLAEAIGIDSIDGGAIDLTQYDPLQAAEEQEASDVQREVALSAAQAAIQIGSIIVTNNELGGDANTLLESIADGVIDAAQQGPDTRLQDTLSEVESIELLLSNATNNADPSVSAVADNLATTNREITQAESLDAIVNEQTVLFRKVGVEIDTTAAPIYGRVVANQVENTNTFEVTLSRPPLENVMVNVEPKEPGSFEPSSVELHFDEDNWDQPQYVTLFKSGRVPITQSLSTGISFPVNDELSSAEFRHQEALSVAFLTNIDRSSPLELNIINDGDHVILSWNRGVLQTSDNLKDNSWNDVTLFGIEGQNATSPHRVKKDTLRALFRLREQ